MGASNVLIFKTLEVPGEKTSNEWLEPVTDEEYNKLQEEE